MNSKRGERTIAYEQLIGADSECTVQQDRVRVDYVRRPSGAKILLAVVADGDGHAAAGASAQVVIEQVFETVRQSKDKDLNATLVRGLVAGNRAIKGTGGQVAATVLAIRNHRVHLAHVGHTMGFLIRGGMTRSLTQRDTNLLGTSSSPMIQTNSPRGEMLNSGDQIVLASDGLTRLNPEDGKPFVDPKALPTYMEGNSPREAARHLISIAMGRDVDDNVSVIVIQAPWRRESTKSWWVLAAIPLGLGLIITLILLGFPRSEGDVTSATIDYGYGVILSGSAFIQTVDGESRRVDKLGTIPPMAIVEVEQDTRLTLQSSLAASSDLSSISVYLAAESKLQITSADTYLPSEAQGRGDQAHPTSLSYLDGTALVVRGSGSRSIQITREYETVSLTGTGRAVFGIQNAGGIIIVDCIQGNCSFEGRKGEITPFHAGQSLSLSESEAESIEVNTLLVERVAFWDDLCASCLSAP